MALWVNYRPDNARSLADMSLNPEPAAPEEREAQHLPPKSFADAAQEALEPQSHANGVDGVDEHTATQNDVKSYRPKANGVSVLRIVDTDGHQNDDTKSMNGSNKDSAKDLSSLKDQESYEGTGTDETPKSPKAKTHHRKGSRSSLGSVGRTYGVSLRNDLKNVGAEVQSAATGAAADVHDEAIDLHNQVDGTRRRVENNAERRLEDAFLQEKPRMVNGDTLTTVKPSMDAGKDGRIDRPLKRRDSELKAGRQAGAGWAKSKYVRSHIASLHSFPLLY